MANRKEENIITGKAPLALPDMSYGQYTLDKLRNNPLRIVQVDGQTGRFMTNRDILVRSVKLAVILGERGVEVGDAIAISAENHINWLVAAYATLYRGAAVVPMNPQYAKGEIVHCLNIAKPKIIFVSRRSEALVSQVNETLAWSMEIIELDDVPLCERIPCLESILGESRAWPDPYNYKAINIERPDSQPMVVLYSSGTTGMPKGVMLSHRNMFAEEFAMLDPDFGNFSQNDVVLTVIPFFHGYGFTMMMYFIHVGATAIAMSSFEPEIYFDLVEKYRVSIILAVPPMMNFFAKHPMISRYDYSSLRSIYCGAAPLLPEMRRDALKRLGNPILRAGYGMTEISVIICLNSGDMRKPESVGFLAPGASCKVIDPKTSLSLRHGQPGEMCFKGNYVMLGYMNDPRATSETIDDNGWLHSGDLGYYDEDGDLFIVGRLKELIKYKGFQVSPCELESLLLKHHDITDAAVIGKSDENSDELPMAFVVVRAGSKLNADEIRRFVDEQVSPQSKLRGGVHFVKAIPKNPGGKILRRELLKLVSKL